MSDYDDYTADRIRVVLTANRIPVRVESSVTTLKTTRVVLSPIGEVSMTALAAAGYWLRAIFSSVRWGWEGVAGGGWKIVFKVKR